MLSITTCFFRAKPQENIRCYAAPYRMPFSTDPSAKKLLDEALVMTENKDESAEKMTKWVFAYRPNPQKKLTKIERFKKNIDKYGEGTAEFAAEGIRIYVENK